MKGKERWELPDESRDGWSGDKWGKAGLLSAGQIVRLTKGQILFRLSPKIASRGWYEIALFFWALFTTKAHLHDKQCHFEAACVVSGYPSLIPDLLLPSVSFLILPLPFLLTHTVMHLFQPPLSLLFIYIYCLCLEKKMKHFNVRKLRTRWSKGNHLKGFRTLACTAITPVSIIAHFQCMYAVKEATGSQINSSSTKQQNPDFVNLSNQFSMQEATSDTKAAAS